MNYRILQARIDFPECPIFFASKAVERGYVTITVAIQSNPLDEELKRWKAYSLDLPTDEILNFQRAASGGIKLYPKRATELFPDLAKTYTYES